MRYLYDFASAFFIIYQPFILALSAGMMSVGAVLLVVWGILPHITRRV